MFEFSLFRIPIRVEPWHWLILAILGIQASGLNSRDDLLLVVLFMAAGFVSILVHELGHALTGRKFGAQGTQIVLHGMGGVAIFPSARFTRTQSFFTTAAGPGIQLLLGALALILLMTFGNQLMLSRFLSYIVLVSFFWAILNCVPVWPLDGGQMLQAILGPQRRELTHKVSIIVAVVVGLLGFATSTMLFFPIFLGFLAYQNWQILQQSGGWR